MEEEGKITVASRNACLQFCGYNLKILARLYKLFFLFPLSLVEKDFYIRQLDEPSDHSSRSVDDANAADYRKLPQCE